MKRCAVAAGIVALVVFCLMAVAWSLRPAGRSVETIRLEEGVATEYEYDNLHRLTRVTYPSGSQIIYEYDAVGNRTSKLVVER